MQTVCRGRGAGRGAGRSVGRRSWRRLALAACVVLLASSVSAQKAGAPPGKWRPARRVHPDSVVTEEEAYDLERLRTIGYLSGSEPVPDRTGITLYKRGRTYDGLNLYISGHFPGAILMDMNGNVVHEWRFEFERAWPDYRTEQLSEDTTGYWMEAYVYPNGDLLAIFGGLGLIKIDKNSNLIWKYMGGCHHDLEVLDDGTIYVLTREEKIFPAWNPGHPIRDDAVTVLSPEGEELERISLFEAMVRSPYANVLMGPGVRMATKFGDIFHTNSVEVLDDRIADRVPAFRRGNVLVSLRTLNLVGVVDLERREFVWALSGMWNAQHHPTMLGNGHMLVFDNRGGDNGSRVIEFDPATQEVVWVYEGNEEHPFYSEKSGANQRLPNGNTLITESNAGRVFEVTADGEIVWEFLNPARAGDEDQFIATLFEMERLPADFPLDWLR